MKLTPVALVIFYRKNSNQNLEVWVQVREDDGPLKGFLEFPGGGIEALESPLDAAVREVEEEVGIVIDPKNGVHFGTFSHRDDQRSILLFTYLFEYDSRLDKKGQLLSIKAPELSEPFRGKIPPLNHQIIDELYHSLYDPGHE